MSWWGATKGEVVTEQAFDSLEILRRRLRRFAVERDWEQFHSPKNLILALVGEVGEVAEHFQWRSDKAAESLSEEVRAEVALELADVLFYLVRLADRLELSLADAAQRKLAINEQRYPAEKVRGSSRKYSEY